MPIKCQGDGQGDGSIDTRTSPGKLRKTADAMLLLALPEK